MNTAAGEVLGAMITPAVLISASGTLVLSTSNRLSRVVDRVRSLSSEAEQSSLPGGKALVARRAVLIGSQLVQLAQRAEMLRTALTTLYASIGLFVATSLGVAAVVLFSWTNFVAIAPGITGAFALLYGSLLLVREARLAIVSTLEEMDYARANVKATLPDERKPQPE
ncbi:MAG: DUF2721 domain-containing protein [Thermoanaerobaculia bacterium]|nr:DUF2721 domain-containing protein [Thermoanaerobaculia bacterium]